MRLGIYGGTFSPPHRGHLHAALTFLDAASLNKLLIIPTAIPPHKQMSPHDDPALRLAMTHAAFDGTDPRIEVSDYEIRKADVSYTWQTLTHFAELLRTELFFLCGTDMFVTLGEWRRPEVILSLATVACILRNADPEQKEAVKAKEREYRERFGAKLMLIDSEPLPVSSTEIRSRVREGKDIDDLVPAKVSAMIRAHGLYRG